jgi:hypothetical protein
VGGIFCDLKKAFDSVNHKILLSELEFYGLSGPMHKLILWSPTGIHLGSPVVLDLY